MRPAQIRGPFSALDIAASVEPAIRHGRENDPAEISETAGQTRLLLARLLLAQHPFALAAPLHMRCIRGRQSGHCNLVYTEAGGVLCAWANTFYHGIS